MAHAFFCFFIFLKRREPLGPCFTSFEHALVKGLKGFSKLFLGLNRKPLFSMPSEK